MSSSDTAFVMPNGHSTESMTHPVSLTSEQVNLEESIKHNSNNSNNNTTSNTTNQTSMNSINENNNRSQNNTNENNSKFINNNFRKASSAERMLNASYQHYTPEKVRNNINHKATTPIQERSFANNNNTYNNININRQHNNIINAEAKTARVETSNLNARSPLRTSFTQLENNYIRSDTVPMTSAANTFFPPTYHTMPPNLQKSKTNHNANDNNRSNNNISNTNSNAASSENVSTNINAVNATNKGPDNTNNNKFNNINNINNNSNNNNSNNNNISNNIASKNSINTVNHLRQIRSTSLSQQKDLFLSSWAEAFAKKHLLCNFCQNVVVNPVQVLPLPVLACRVCARTRASGGPLSVIELPQSISAAIQEIVSHGNVSHENKRGHPADDIDNHPAIRRRDGNESAHVADNVLLSAEMLKANNNNNNSNSNSNSNNTEVLKSVSTPFQSESQAKNGNSIQNLTSAEHVFANLINAATTRVEKHIHAEVFDDNEEQQLQEQLKEQEKQKHMSESQTDHHHQNYHYHYEQNLLQAHQQQNLKENEQHREEQEEEEEEEEQYHEEEEEYKQEKQEEQHHRENSNDRMQKAAIEASMYALTVFNNTLNQLVEAENNERELINQKQSQTWTEFVKTVKAVMREWKNTPKPPSSRDLKMEADRLYESAHYEKALDLYNEAIRLQTTDRLTQARFLFGNRSAANFMARHYRDCIDDCLEVIRLEPQNVKMLSRAARAAATMGELPLAVSLMERVGAERMTETMRLEFEKYKLGLEMYNKAEKLFGTDEADEPFRMLIAQFPETLLFRERYGASLMKRKHYSKAVEVFEVINAKIRPSKVRFLMADSLYHMGFEHFQRARELLAPAAGIHDDCTQLLHIIDKVDDGKQRGNNNFAQKNFTAAVENYSEAIRFATDNDQILRILFCNRAAANKEIGRFREGVEDCTKALKIDPQFAKAYARRARCHAHLNDPYTAVEDFKRAVELDSDDKDLLKELRNAEAVLAREAEREKDYYYQLGLSRGATEREIRLKYKELSLRWHPDKCVALGPVEKERAEHKFKVISEAYTVLMDPAKRREYELKFDRERYFKPAFQSYSTTFSHSNEYFRGPRHRAGPSGYW